MLDTGKLQAISMKERDSVYSWAFEPVVERSWHAKCEVRSSLTFSLIRRQIDNRLYLENLCDVAVLAKNSRR
eukprot:2359057-Amphidinium_carterae.1